MVHLMSMLFFFTGVKYLPLAKAASISFTAPFFVALLAWPMLGERITASRLMAVLVAIRGRAHRHPPRHRRVPVGLALHAGQRRLLRALPDPDAPRRRARFGRDLRRLQRAGRHGGDVDRGAVRVDADRIVGRRRPAVLARHHRRHRPLLRGARHGQCAGQHHRPVRVLAADRLGDRRLHHLGLSARCFSPGSAPASSSARGSTSPGTRHGRGRSPVRVGLERQSFACGAKAARPRPAPAEHGQCGRHRHPPGQKSP